MVQCTFPLLLNLAFLAVVWRANGQGDLDFDLADALDHTEKPKPKPKPPQDPTHNIDDDWLDFFDTPVRTTTKPPRTVTKLPPKQPDIFIRTTTKKPRATKVPPRKPGPQDLDLADALDSNNDKKGDISDSDLEDILDDGYNPDKKKGGRGGGGGGKAGAGDQTDSDYGNQAETGTIAGIASALAMALIGAVSSYISYQQKKFCFSIQEGLNAEYVKGENMEAVVTEEPQVKCSALESQSAAPLTEDASKV
ncbi:CD99 antigen-like protein 2 isoform 2-T2 [Rhinophrynus dorsalis]